MDSKSLATLDAVIESACLELFESVGTPISTALASDKLVDDVGAAIGFTSPSLRGCLVIISTRRLLQQTLPPEAHSSGPEQVADWIAELSNQLLGRIKNKLLGCGVTIAMSTPTVIFGLELARKGSRLGVHRQFSFRHADQPLAVFVDADAAAGLELQMLKDLPPAIPEGELELF